MSSDNIMDKLAFEQRPDKQMLVQRDNYTVIRISLGKGALIPPHIANHSAFFLVLKGRVVFTTGETEIEVRENQFTSMEANQMRGMQALEDSVILGVRD